ncbi:hypothetical protein KM043_003366 [Ampulex compressa]|nr:hypothetical protein KM043_003366 [Ampulex compressa]
MPLALTGLGKLKYGGQFREGVFHGAGSVRLPGGQRMDCLWISGQLMVQRYIFADGLIYVKGKWDYCNFPDRRFYKCIMYGLHPAGDTLKTDSLSTSHIPRLCYDVGYGTFEPYTRCVRSYKNPNKVLRIPTAVQAEWIKRNCRKGWTEPSGHIPHLYENWFPKVQQSRISAAVGVSLIPKGFSENWWKRLTAFDKCDG